jgi:nicotinate-nucleotide adenylyltransferase
MGNVAHRFDQIMTSQNKHQIASEKRQRTGLLGGSFNPAHDGHLHISNLALKHLNLDCVWWMVSPQNPLKSENGMAKLDQRIEKARKVATNPNIIVTDIERKLGTQYTSDTLPALQRIFPENSFVWLMGADNLTQIEHWHRWKTIFLTLPVAIFARPTYSNDAENAKSVKQFAPYQLIESDALTLVDMKPPAWIFLKTPLNPESATEIRSRTNGDWTSK